LGAGGGRVWAEKMMESKEKRGVGDQIATQDTHTLDGGNLTVKVNLQGKGGKK